MTTPQRIQLKRAKGWRLPANTTCVTRPGKWGNPFKVGGWFRVDWTRPPAYRHFETAWEQKDDPAEGFTKIENHAMAVEWFDRMVSHNPHRFAEIRGKNLACWCPLGGPCHAEVLLKIANPDVESSAAKPVA